MKSEHRHELAENDLSKLLGHWTEKFDENSNSIISVVAVVAIIAAGIIYWTRTSRFEQANGWTQLAACNTPEDFANVADAFSGSSVAEWAQLRAADGYLQEGVRLSITDRPASSDRLEQAREAYQSLIGASTPSAIREQAMNGLAVTLESLSDGDTEPAISAYQDLLAAFPETRFKTWAEDRIDALKTGRVQEFYAWFHTQNPQPADMPLPQDQLGLPDNPLNTLLPELGGLGIPDDAEGPKLGDEPFVPPLAKDDDTKTDGDEPNPFEPESTSEPGGDDLPPAEGDESSETSDGSEDNPTPSEPAPSADDSTSPSSDE